MFGARQRITADSIFINTGARPSSPVPRLADVAVLDSTTIGSVRAGSSARVKLAATSAWGSGDVHRFGNRVTIVRRAEALLARGPGSG
jgi:pyruvate/2-oxoglutarate dehydrogenase complex dihydrolipoamide dehydrogenase (E3) component